jgi:septal ring factor EnvC (AmiA/AmiB activator)
MECVICCERYNKSNHKKIECPRSEKCEGVCVSCVKRDIMRKSKEEYECMYCKKEWKEEYLLEVLPKSFMKKEYKEYREKVLVEEQIARMPETQEIAKKVKKCEEIEEECKKLEKEIKKIEIEKKKLQNEKKKLQRRIYEIREEIYMEKEEKKEYKYTYKCQKEKCEGYLNNKYECGICEKKFCKECLEEKTENHKCNEEKKETIKLLK